MKKNYDNADYICIWDRTHYLKSFFEMCSDFCDADNDDYILNVKDRERIGSRPAIMSA